MLHIEHEFNSFKPVSLNYVWMHNWKNERLAHGAHWRRDIHKAEVLSRDLVTISCSQKKNSIWSYITASWDGPGCSQTLWYIDHSGQRSGEMSLWGECSEPEAYQSNTHSDLIC